MAALLPLLALAAGARAASCPSKSFDLTSASGVNADFQTQLGGSGVSYDNGLKMTLTESNNNIVLQSYETYSLPLKLDMSLKASTVPGIITTMAAWGGDESKDAIDLETAGSLSNLVLLSLFRAGKSDSGYNTEIQADAVSPLPNWDWMQMPNGYDSSDASYTMIWTEDAITWNVNGQFVAKYTPKDGAQWLTSEVPIRLGLWANDPSADWAGKLDWDSNPKAEATFTSLTLSCPSDDEVQSNAKASETSQAAPSSDDSTSTEQSTEEQEASTSSATPVTAQEAQEQEADSMTSSVAPSSSSNDNNESNSSTSKRDSTSSSSSENDTNSASEQDDAASEMAASSGMVSAQRASGNASDSSAPTFAASSDETDAVKAVKASAGSSSSSASSDDEPIEDSSARMIGLSWGLAALMVGRLFI